MAADDARVFGRRLPLRSVTVLRNPTVYWAWALFVVLSLAATWFVDPFLFGFASLGLAGSTGLVGVLGGLAVLLSGENSVRTKVRVGLALLVAALAVASALVALRGFDWA